MESKKRKGMFSVAAPAVLDFEMREMLAPKSGNGRVPVCLQISAKTYEMYLTYQV